MFVASYQRTEGAAPKRVNIWSEAQRLKRLAEQEARIAAEREERFAAEGRELEARRRALAQQRRRDDEAIIRMRPGNVPLACDVLKAEAAKLGFSVLAITGLGRDKGLIVARHACIKAVAEARPDLTKTQIGRLFKRDHTTILSSLGMTKRSKARRA